VELSEGVGRGREREWKGGGRKRRINKSSKHKTWILRTDEGEEKEELTGKNLPEGSVPGTPSKVLLVIWKRASSGVPLAELAETDFDDEDEEVIPAADEQDFLAFLRPEDEWQEEEEEDCRAG